MRKLGGILAIAVLALTACSAPVETSPAPSVSAKVEMTSPTETETITAAPITVQTETQATVTAEPTEGAFGDPAADGPFLEAVRSKWLGPVPADDALVSAAKFACEALANGATYEETEVVEQPEGDRSAELNNAMLSAYASVNYCISLAY